MEGFAMEKRDSEKNWDNFWLSGRIDDYLHYRSSVGSSDKHKEDVKTHGTVSDSDRDGANGHANFRI